MNKLFIVVNEDRFFLSHRKEIALSAQQEGWNVTVVCKDTGQRGDVEKLGLKMVELPVNPTGMNMAQEFKTFRFLYFLYRMNKDAIVHHVGLKCILWGGLAAKFTKVRGVVNAVSGLGTVFSSEKPGLAALGILAIMRFSSKRKGVKEIFQNSEDKELFLSYKVVRPDQTAFIKGSGVDLNEFCYTPEPEDGPIKVVFSARMIKEKGVMELLDAAEILRPEFGDRAQFLLCGRLASNADAVPREVLESRCDGRYLVWMGLQSDMKSILGNSHIFAFPSYYREGVPKSLIEACAVGRPIVTTDSIGCRDVVFDGENGYLVPVCDSRALADKLRVLLEDKALRERMGRAGRAKAEKEFGLESVIQKHLEIYRSLNLA